MANAASAVQGQRQGQGPGGACDLGFLQDLFSLEGRVAVVFGGTGELCGAMAAGLYRAGATVCIVGRSQAKAERLCEGRDPARFQFLAFDVSSGTDPCEVRDQVLARHGRVDVLVNGVGVNSSTALEDLTDDDIRRVLDTNFSFVVRTCRAFLPALVRPPSGPSGAGREVPGASSCIINVGSVSAVVPLSKVWIYSASKAALHNFTKNLAREYGAKGVRANVLVPGFFPAEQNRAVLTQERQARILGQTPVGRFGHPAELVPACLLLASAQGSSFINGAEVLVDGGFCATKI